MQLDNLRRLIDAYRELPADTPILWSIKDCAAGVIVRKGWGKPFRGCPAPESIQEFLECDRDMADALFYCQDHPRSKMEPNPFRTHGPILSIVIRTLEGLHASDGKSLIWR